MDVDRLFKFGCAILLWLFIGLLVLAIISCLIASFTLGI